MNPKFPATPEEMSGIQTRVAMLQNLLYVFNKPPAEKLGDDVWGDSMGDDVWGDSMLRNFHCLMGIYDAIIRRKNEAVTERDSHPTPADCAQAEEVFKEVKANPGHSFSLQMDPNMMSVLVGALQLSIRHPYFGQSQNAKQVVLAVNAMIDMVPKEIFPNYRAMLEAGWNNPQAPEDKTP